MAMPGDAGNSGGSPLPNVIVPSVFVSSSEGAQPQKMTLRDCNRNLWHLTIEKLGDNWYFTDGWKDFVKANKIAGGDVIVYESPCEGLIDFRILGLSDSKDGVEYLDYRNPEVRLQIKDEPVEGADDFDYHPPQEPKKEDAAGASVKKQKRKRNRNSDFYGAQLFKSGEVTQPLNPYFITVANRTRQNELYIPLDVVRTYNLQLPETLVIWDLAGRRFGSRLRKWRDGRMLYYGGWKAVCQVNLAEKNDRIICEFFKGETGELEIKVRILHATKQEEGR